MNLEISAIADLDSAKFRSGASNVKYLTIGLRNGRQFATIENGPHSYEFIVYEAIRQFLESDIEIPYGEKRASDQVLLVAMDVAFEIKDLKFYQNLVREASTVPDEVIEDIREIINNKVDLWLDSISQQEFYYQADESEWLMLARSAGALAYVKTGRSPNKQGPLEISFNTILTANEGAVSTEVFQAVAVLCFELGILGTRNVRHITPKELIAPYVGSATVNTEQLFEAAKHSLVVIDQAHILHEHSVPGSYWAINTIAEKASQGEHVVVLVGGEKQMTRMLSEYPVLSEHFVDTVNVSNLEFEQLVKLCETELVGHNMLDVFLANDQQRFLNDLDAAMQDPKFANTKWVRRWIRKYLNKQAMILLREPYFPPQTQLPQSEPPQHRKL